MKHLKTILILTILVRLISLGVYPLMDKTEARYAEIAREMVATDNWVTPQLEPGVPFWGKPPLSFWLSAASFKMFGLNEFAARLPSVLLAIGVLYLLFLYSRTLRDRTFALKSTVILATTGLFFMNAGTVMTDPSLSAGVCLAMVAFVLMMKAQPRGQQRLWGYLFFVGAAVGVLAKGPVACVLIGIPLVLWCLFYKKWGEVFTRLPLFSGLFVFCLVALPWYFMAEKATPGFVEYFIVGEHWQRFTVKNWGGDLYGSGHAQPKGMIWLFLVPATMPWMLVFGGAFIAMSKQKDFVKGALTDPWIGYSVFWLLSPLLLFTMASNILVPYITPSLPAFAFLMTIVLEEMQKRPLWKPLKWIASQKTFLSVAVFVPICFFIAAFTFLPVIGRNSSQQPIVDAYKKIRSRPDSALVYIDTMPYSADFYGQGQVIDIPAPDFHFEEIEAYFDDDKEDYFVLNRDNKHGLPQKLLRGTSEVFRHRNYSLLQELHPSVVPKIP